VPPQRGRGAEGGREGEALVRAALEHKALARLNSDPKGTSRSPKETYYRVKRDLLGTVTVPGKPRSSVVLNVVQTRESRWMRVGGEEEVGEAETQVRRPSLYHPECFLLLLLLRRGGGVFCIPIRMLLPCLVGIARGTCRRKCRLTAALPTRGFPRKRVTSAWGLRYASTSTNRTIGCNRTIYYSSIDTDAHLWSFTVSGGCGKCEGRRRRRSL